MTSVLSTINPLFERNQTLTRSIYTTFQRSKREGGLKDSANVLTNVAETAALEFNDEDLVFNTSEGNNKFAVSKAGNVSVSNNLSVAGVLTLKDASVSNIVDSIVDAGSSGELPTTAAVVKQIQTTTADLETDINNLDKDIGDLEKLKADKSYVDTQLALKADRTTINDLDRDIGNLETDIDNLTTEIGTKADKSYVDTQLALKSDLSNVYTKKETDQEIQAALAGDISANKLNSATTITASGNISGLSLSAQNSITAQAFIPRYWVDAVQDDYGRFLQFYGLVNTEVYNDAEKMQYIDKDKMAPSVALMESSLLTVPGSLERLNVKIGSNGTSVSVPALTKYWAQRIGTITATVSRQSGQLPQRSILTGHFRLDINFGPAAGPDQSEGVDLCLSKYEFLMRCTNSAWSNEYSCLGKITGIKGSSTIRFGVYIEFDFWIKIYVETSSIEFGLYVRPKNTADVSSTPSWLSAFMDSSYQAVYLVK